MPTSGTVWERIGTGPWFLLTSGTNYIRLQQPQCTVLQLLLIFPFFRPAEKRFPTGLRLLDQCEVILTNERVLFQILTNQVMVVHDTEYVGDWPANWWKAKGEHRCVLGYPLM